MMDFDFVSPTRIIYGRGSEEKTGQILRKYGFKKVLIVHSGGSTVRSGLIDRVRKSLEEEGIRYVELTGIQPNPEKKKVEEGVALAKAEEIDCLLAIGGGSAIDTAKSIAANYYLTGDVMDVHTKKATAERALPIGVILTIASAGSELSNSSVITDPDIPLKAGFRTDAIRPLFAIENPELTYGVPPYQTAAGITDMMMHTMERFFNPSFAYQFSDDFGLDLCKRVMEAGLRAMENPCDYDARGALMLLSGLAHNGLTGIGKNNTFTVHGMEHVLSAVNPDIAHGAGIAVCYLGWARVYAQDPQVKAKLARLARHLFEIDDEDDAKAAIIGINRMESFYKTIGMPTTLRELGFSGTDLPRLADLATGNGTRTVGCCPQPLDRQAVLLVYEHCL